MLKRSLHVMVFSLSIGLLAGLTGCKSNEQTDLLAQAGVEVAVNKVIQAGPDPIQRAGRVYAIAVDARGLLSGETVTLPELEKAVRDRLVNENLSATDLVLVDTLVRYISLELARQVGSDKLDPDEKVAVDKVLSWVIGAASITQPPTSSSASST